MLDAAARHRAGHRPDRQRQDDDALRRARRRSTPPTRNILTVEDPVEYQLDGINQIQVKPQIGLTFAHGLRSILRQDPDVIMVGEIRDAETAQIAIQAALTGHLVLSTLHTNDAAGAVTRLLDMGVEDYLLTSTLNGILAQRLVRRSAPSAARAYEAPPNLVDVARRHWRRRAADPLPRGRLPRLPSDRLPRSDHGPRAAGDDRDASAGSSCAAPRTANSRRRRSRRE